NLNLRGRSIPMFAYIGLAGTGAAWLVQVSRNHKEATIGLVWMLIGPVVYFVYRRSKGLSLTETVRAPMIILAPSAEITYDNILVPVLQGRLDQRAMVAACRLAAARGATIVVAAVME